MFEMMPSIEKIQHDLEQLIREKEAVEEQLNALVRRQAQTTFLDYIRSVEHHVYSTLSVGRVSPEPSIDQARASVANKFYPQHFQPWPDFAAVHNATFDRLAATFADTAYFAPVSDAKTTGRDLHPHITNDASLYPFLRAAVEKPASRVVSKYLCVTSNPRIYGIKFRNHDYGVTPAIAQDVGAAAAEGSAIAGMPPHRPAKRRSPAKELGVPDRWLLALRHDDRLERILVGEVKPTHLLPGDKLARVMSAPPSDDFFPRAAKQDGIAPAPGRAVPGSMGVAAAIGQAYHYMITAGLEYGYVASGDGLVFLRVREDTPDTLYYFWTVIPARPSDDVAAARAPRETAMAHMATLCMLAAESTPRSPTWIADRDKDLARWPPAPMTATTTAAGNKAAARAVPREFLAHTGLLAVPYCTQGCLRSLCCDEPLDDRCPNVARHRAAAYAQGGDGRYHALTASQLQARVVAQLAEDMSVDCHSLLWDGFYGRYGVLFKLSATGFGYTFVGKAVQHAHYCVLAHEAAIYDALDTFQGRLIPVCLGVVELARSIPLGNCQYVAHMLLMAYAGPMSQPGNTPDGVDLELEEEKTASALCAAGLQNDDIHGGNMAWNAERQCVMQFDFDQAYMRPVPFSLLSAPAMLAAPVVKRERDEDQSSNGVQDERDQVAKRARGAHTTTL